MTASSPGSKSCPPVVEYDLPLDYENHKPEMAIQQNHCVLEYIHWSFT